MFKEARLWHRAMYGDLYQQLLQDGHPSPPLSDDPTCTRSQIVAYRDGEGREVAVVHQYVRPDGKLGGSAQKPDPQEMRGEDGTWYIGIEYPDAVE
jgi:hypothetical protein